MYFKKYMYVVCYVRLELYSLIVYGSAQRWVLWEMSRCAHLENLNELHCPA